MDTRMQRFSPPSPFSPRPAPPSSPAPPSAWMAAAPTTASAHPPRTTPGPPILPPLPPMSLLDRRTAHGHPWYNLIMWQNRSGIRGISQNPW